MAKWARMRGRCLLSALIASTNLSKSIDMAFQGEEVIIAKNNLPLIALMPYKPKEKRRLGLLAGQIKIPEGFLNEDEEINDLIYGTYR